MSCTGSRERRSQNRSENQRTLFRRHVPCMTLCRHDLRASLSFRTTSMLGNARERRSVSVAQLTREAADRASSVAAGAPLALNAAALLVRRWTARGAGQAPRRARRPGLSRARAAVERPSGTGTGTASRNSGSKQRKRQVPSRPRPRPRSRSQSRCVGVLPARAYCSDHGMIE